MVGAHGVATGLELRAQGVESVDHDRRVRLAGGMEFGFHPEMEHNIVV